MAVQATACIAVAAGDISLPHSSSWRFASAAGQNSAAGSRSQSQFRPCHAVATESTDPQQDRRTSAVKCLDCRISSHWTIRSYHRAVCHWHSQPSIDCDCNRALVSGAAEASIVEQLALTIIMWLSTSTLRTPLLLLLCITAASLIAAAAEATAMTTLHVCSVRGSDSRGDGSAASPFATVTAARDALRALRRGGGGEGGGAATVLLHEGTHAPFALDPALDSGTASAPIRYAGAPGANAVVSAGVEVPTSAWTPWAGHPHIVTADLKALGLSNFGSLPRSGGSIDACNQLSGGKMQLFHRQAAMVLARFPNLAPNGDWRFLYVTSEAKGGGLLLKAGANASRVYSWAKEEAPYLHGYWSWDWSDSIQAMLSATSSGGGNVTVGLPTGVVAKPHARFYGLNLLSELDTPDEYYIDAKGKIYYWPASPPEAWSSAPHVSVNMTAVKLDGTSHVTLENVTVAHARGARAASPAQWAVLSGIATRCHVCSGHAK
jgi:hypothetical protein